MIALTLWQAFAAACITYDPTCAGRRAAHALNQTHRVPAWCAQRLGARPDDVVLEVVARANAGLDLGPIRQSLSDHPVLKTCFAEGYAAGARTSTGELRVSVTPDASGTCIQAIGRPRSRLPDRRTLDCLLDGLRGSSLPVRAMAGLPIPGAWQEPFELTLRFRVVQPAAKPAR